METKEVRMEVSDRVKELIKNSIEEWKGRSFEELEAFVAEQMAKDIERQENCKYCHDEECSTSDISKVEVNAGVLGKISAGVWMTFDEDPHMSVDFYAEAPDETTITFEKADHSTKINFCPFCGRRLREE